LVLWILVMILFFIGFSVLESFLLPEQLNF